MEVYRIVKKKYAASLSGIGASIAGGRWNSKGVEVVYTSQSRALSVLEILVHLPKSLLPDDLVFLQIFIPDSLSVRELKREDLPKNWHQFPPLRETQLLGDSFIKESKFAVFKVPSAIVKNEFNLLLNPHHPDFKEIKILEIEKFDLDNRLL